MKLTRPQARKLLWLASARLEETVGPEDELACPSLKALVRRDLAVVEPTPRNGIVALNLTDAGRAEAARRMQPKMKRPEEGWKQTHYRGTRRWVRTEA